MAFKMQSKPESESSKKKVGARRPHPRPRTPMYMHKGGEDPKSASFKAVEEAKKKAAKLFDLGLPPRNRLESNTYWEWRSDIPMEATIKGSKDAKAVDANDPDQGYLDDCYLVASLAAIALVHPELIESMITVEGEGEERVWVVTFKYAKGGAKIVRLPFGAPVEEGMLPTKPGDFMFARSHDTREEADGSRTFEAWPMILEAAIMQVVVGQAAPRYGVLEDSDLKPRGDGVMEMLLGSAQWRTVPASQSELRTFLESVTRPMPETRAGPAAREMATPVILMTRSRESRPADAANPMVDEHKVSLNHSYAVVEAYLDPENPDREWISLRNPLGHRHLFEFPLTSLLVGDPEQPEVRLFRSFVVGRLTS